MTSVDWPNSMNDMSGRQISASGDNRLAGGQSLRVLRSPDFLASSKNRWSTGAMNGAVDATTAQKSRVGCVDDCIDIQAGDVSDDNSHAPVEKRCFSFLHWIQSQVGILFAVTQPLRHAA